MLFGDVYAPLQKDIGITNRSLWVEGVEGRGVWGMGTQHGDWRGLYLPMKWFLSFKK